MKALIGWMKVKGLQFPDIGNELMDIPVKERTVSFIQPTVQEIKQYVKVVILPVEE